MAQIVLGRAIHRMFAESLEPMARAIGSSLGPFGRAMLCDRGGRVGRAGSGTAIAREISAGGPRCGVAQRVLTETLVSADRDLGDGTARLALIAAASFRAGARSIAAGVPAGALADALDRKRTELAAMIAAEGGGDADMADVALTAGAGPDLAEALAAAFRQVGASGGIEIAASRERGVETEVSSGFLFDAAAIGALLPGGETLSLQEVHVIAADDMIADFGSLAPVVEGFAGKRKSLLIVARDISGPALAVLERNRKAGILSVLAVKPAEAGPQAAHLIEDLALATGAALVAERNGLSLSSLRPDMLGRAEALKFSGSRLELRGPAGKPSAVEARIGWLEEEIRQNRYLSLDRERAERRRARLLGRWAEIRVGGANDHETESLVETGRRAVACMRSAQGSGVVAGGGQALAKVADRIEAGGGDAVAAAAARTAAEGLRSIRRQLRRNAGGEAGFCGGGAGMPAAAVPSSVVDPLRLTQVIVDQALSVATALLRVDAAVIR